MMSRLSERLSICIGRHNVDLRRTATTLLSLLGVALPTGSQPTSSSRLELLATRRSCSVCKPVAALATIVLLAVLTGVSPASAEDKPSDRNLVLAGMAMGIPTYMVGVSVHEGSHALAGKLVGAKIVDFSLIPGWHPRTDKFYFGYVTVRGLRSEGQKAWFLVAPKLSDALLLGGYATLHATDSLPANAYGQTAFLVLATGFWIDFSRDIVAWWDHNDTVKVYNILGLDTELKRLPARLLHAGASALLGYSVYRGYRDLFADETGTTGNGALVQPVLLPLFDQSF